MVSVLTNSVNAPGLGQSRQAILSTLKREGEVTIPELSQALGLNVETVREHVKALSAQGLVVRRGQRSRGPGRPEVVYGLSDDAEALFPRREAEVLRGLAQFLVRSGNESLLREFFDAYVEDRREASLARVEGLTGKERLEEAARILSEQGFMAVVEDVDGEPALRLCHCPLRELVAATRIPCRAEIGFVQDLVGGSLARVTYMPEGDLACVYRAKGRR